MGQRLGQRLDHDRVMHGPEHRAQRVVLEQARVEGDALLGGEGEDAGFLSGIFHGGESGYGFVNQE